MLGSGRTELLRGIFGADPVDRGEVLVEGKTYQNGQPDQDGRKPAVGLTPENRKIQGLILVHSIRDNLCYASMNITADGWIENKRKRNSLRNDR